MSVPTRDFHLRRSVNFKIDIIDFVRAGIRFRYGNRFRIDINANHAFCAEAFRRESETFRFRFQDRQATSYSSIHESSVRRN